MGDITRTLNCLRLFILRRGYQEFRRRYYKHLSGGISQIIKFVVIMASIAIK